MPRSSSSPSIAARPRRKPSVVRRATSTTLPRNSSLPLRLVEDRRDRVLVPALRLAHPQADADRLRHGEMDAPFLDLGARCAALCRSRRSSPSRRRSCGSPAPSTSSSALWSRPPRCRAGRRACRDRGADRRPRRWSSAPRDRRGPSCRHRPPAARDAPPPSAAGCRCRRRSRATSRRGISARAILPGSRPRGRCCGCRRAAPGRPAARPCWRPPRPNPRRRDRSGDISSTRCPSA